MFGRGEIIGGVLAIAMIVVMGVLVAHGPFHDINKVHAAVGPPLHVTIITNPKTIGQYQPATIHARVGQVVIFTNNSNADHTATATDNSFNTSNIPTGGATGSITVTRKGTFSYYCIYHPFMKGTIIVGS